MNQSLKTLPVPSLHLNCFTNLCHVWTENVPLVHLNVKFRHWHHLVHWCTRNMSLSRHFRMEETGRFLRAPHRKGGLPNILHRQ